jgi:Tol biopolymer transport system component
MRPRYGVLLASVALVAVSCTGITRVSVSSTQGNGASSAPALSHDGRFVAFQSSASNLVPNDTNNVADIFLRNTAAGSTVLVSVATNGAQANGASSRPFVSADGRFVAFTSLASNLDTDSDSVADVFLRDRQAGTTTNLTERLGSPVVANAISANGRYVLLTIVAQETTPIATVMLADAVSGNLSQQSDPSRCEESDLGGTPVEPRVGGATMDSAGHHVAYWVTCTIGQFGGIVVLNDRTTGNHIIAVQGVRGDVGSAGRLALAPDASTIVWYLQITTGRGGDSQSVFVWDAETGQRTIDTPPGGVAPLCQVEQCVALSPDGRYLAFETSSGKDGFQLYVCPCRVALLDLTSGEQFDVSQSTKFAPRDGHEPMFEGDGNRITFSSAADDLVFDDSNGVRDVFNRSVQGVLDPGNPGTFVVSND